MYLPKAKKRHREPSITDGLKVRVKDWDRYITVETPKLIKVYYCSNTYIDDGHKDRGVLQLGKMQ